MYVVTVRKTFSAAHRLCQEGLSDEENRKLYGKCSNPNGHGHNYVLEVSVAGDMDPQTGMVVNFFDVTEAIDHLIFSRVDHRNLNVEVDFMKGLVPTAENMAAKFWELLEPHTGRARLHSISLSEGTSNRITYYGPGGSFPGEQAR